MANMEMVRQLLGTLAALATQDGVEQVVQEEERAALRHSIEKIWHAQAVYLAPRYGAVAGEPGYIACGPVLAPVYLVEDIPSAAQLAELADLALAVRVGADGTICMSGSVALLGSLEYVGDIDFCEYAELQAPDGAREVAISVDAHARRAALPLCQIVKAPPAFALRCDSSWDASACARLSTEIEGGARYLKLDFVARTAAVGVVEATNVVLLLDETRATTIARSFAAQEVPLGTVDTVLPRPLGDPILLGRYINFLRNQIDLYLHKDPVKALKRGLSLARIMFLDEHGEVIRELLADGAGALAAAVAAREALRDKLAAAHHADPARSVVAGALHSELEAGIAMLRSADRSAAHDRDWQGAAERALTALMTVTKLLIARV